MRLLSSNSGLALVALVVILGCRYEIRAIEAFPTHFDASADGPVVIESAYDMPADIVAALPPDFRLAGLVGYLTLVLDPLGEIRSRDEDTWRDSDYAPSNQFRESLRKFSTEEFRRFYPPGYRHAVAVIPNIDIVETLEIELAQNWMSFFHDYYAARDALSREEAEFASMNTVITEAEQVLSSLVGQIASTVQATEAARSQSANLDAATAGIKRRQELGDGPLRPLKIQYSFADDILRSVYENRLSDVRGRAPMRNVSNPFLHEETIAAIERANAIIANPSAHLVPHIAEIVEAAALTPITLASASRSPLKQATLTSPTRASYMNSRHALGVAVDVAFSGANYNSRSESPSSEALQNYGAFMMVMASAGLVRPTRMENWSERNHFVVSRFSDVSDGQTNPAYSAAAYTDLAIDMFTAMEAASNAGMIDLLTSRNNLSRQQERQLQQHHKISEAIAGKRAELAQARSKLEAAESKLRASQRKHQAAVEARERRLEAERRQREHERRQRQIADRADRAERARERREHRERMDREERQMRDWMRDLDRRDRERDRREPPDRGGGLRGGGVGLY